MTSTTLSRLQVEITANLAPLRASLAAAEREVSRFSGQANTLTATFRNVGTTLASAGIGIAAMQVVNLSDKFRSLQNSLKVAGLSGAELTAVYKTLTAQAERNFAPVEALVGLFSSTSQAAKDLGASTGDVLKFTNVVAQAMRIAGTSPEAASGALLQLGQMLGSSRVAAEEFNSVAEGIRPLMQAAADGITEAGGSISKLKSLVAAGQVSNKAFFEGAQVGAASFEQKLSGASTTVSGSLTNVRTALTNLVGAIDNASGFSDDIVRGFESLSSAIKTSEGLIGKFGTEFAAAGRFLDGVKAKVDYLADAIGRLTGLKIIGETVNPLLGLGDGNEMTGVKAQASAEDLERGIAKLSARKAELNRVMGDNPAFGTTIAAMGQEIDKATAKLEGMRRAAAGAGLTSTAQSIIDATPAADPPAFSVPAGKSGPKRVSLADFKVEGGVDKAAERQSSRIKDLIADLQEEIRVAGMSAAQQEVSANLRRVNADAASKEGKEIEALTLKLELARQAARDRDDDLRTRQQFQSAAQDIALLGAGTKAVEAARYAREKLFEIERQAAENGPEWAARRKAAVESEAQSWGQLQEKMKQVELAQDAMFERAQLGRSESERRIYSQFNSAGLLDANGEISGALNQRIADQMRWNQTIEATQDAFRGVGREITDALAKGDMKGAGQAILKRFQNMVADQTGQMIDDGISSAIGGIFPQAQGLKGLFAGRPDGSAARPYYVVSAAGALPFAAGPNLLNQKMGGFGAGGDVHRTPLGPIGSTSASQQALSAVSRIPGPGGYSDMIREAAMRYGIDPEIALRVARSEGGTNGWIQSGVTKNGLREPSYGPFQALVGGKGTGFPAGQGNAMLAAGIDPRDPSQASRVIDWQMRYASRNGWGEWYGAKGAGIGNREGIGATPPMLAQTQAIQQSTQQVQDFTANLNTGTQGLGTFGQGLGQFGNVLGQAGGGGGAGAIGGIFSLLGSFAGMFDEGGNLPAGKWGVAGERGPEIVRGPASITGRRDTLAMMRRPSQPNFGAGRSGPQNVRGGDIIVNGNVDKDTMPDLQAAMKRQRREMAEQSRYERANSWRFE